MGRFEGKVAVVTGAGVRVGRDALLMAAQGVVEAAGGLP
jgi:hypothetical protein